MQNLFIFVVSDIKVNAFFCCPFAISISCLVEIMLTISFCDHVKCLYSLYFLPFLSPIWNELISANRFLENEATRLTSPCTCPDFIIGR